MMTTIAGTIADTKTNMDTTASNTIIYTATTSTTATSPINIAALTINTTTTAFMPATTTCYVPTPRCRLGQLR